MSDLSFHPCGDSALTVQLGTRIDAAANRRIIALADDLETAPLPGLRDLVPTYRSLLILYDPAQLRGAELERVVTQRLAVLSDRHQTARHWRIPVLYGGEIGQDLEDLAQAKGMTPAEVIALHASARYRVYMIGFAPGFAYLGGLPEALHTPRLATPRQHIPAGAIGIGGQQGSINSVAGPSGWRYIGWTPIPTFDPQRSGSDDAPFLLRAGDEVSFAPVTEQDATEMAAACARGDMPVQPETGA